MKGLRVEIYRSGYDSEANVFHGFSAVTVVNIDGPFEPTPDAPAARLERNAYGSPILVPDDQPAGMAGPMAGGTYAGSSDSRFGEATGLYGAIPVHDRFETWELYRSMSL